MFVLCHTQPETNGREFHEVPPQQSERGPCNSQIGHAHQERGHKAQSTGKVMIGWLASHDRYCKTVIG